MSFENSQGKSPAEFPGIPAQNNNANNDPKAAQLKFQSSKQSGQGDTEIARLQRENKELKKMITELQQNQQNNKHQENNEDYDELFGQFTQLKKEYKILRKKENESSNRAAQLEYDLQGMKLEKNECQNEVEKLKIEINQLKLKQKENIENEEDDSNDTEQALKMIGDIIEAETKELSEISSQRTEFIKIVHNLEQSNCQYDKLLEDAYSQIEDDKTKLKTLQNKLDETTKENEKEMNDALLSIIKLSPVEYQTVLQQIDENSSNKDKIIALFSYEKRKTKETQTEKENQTEQDPLLTPLTERETSILGHLQNAVQCIKIISESATTPPTENDKEYCLEQIQTIQKFIDSQSQVVEITSLYENEDPEEQIQTFFTYCEKNDVQRSPLYELFTLFKGTLGLNKILFDNLESTSNKSQNNEKKLAKLAKDSKQIASKYDQLRDKLNEASEKLCQCVDKPSSDCFEMIDQLIEEKNEMKSQNQKLDRKAHAEKQAMINNRKKCETEEKKMQKKNDKEIKKLVESYRNLLEEQTNELDQTKAQLEQANRHILELNKQIKQVVSEKDAIQNNAANEIQTVMQQNADLTNQITELKDKQSESLSTIIDANHKAHADEVASLKNKIASIEDQNSQTVAELRDQNAFLSRKYEAQLKTLNSDLGETRKMLQEAQDEISTLEKSKSSLQLQVVKLKLADRTKELKYQQMAEYFNNKSQSDEASSAAKLLAQKSQYESLINDKNDEMELCSQLLRNSLEEDFQVTIEAETPLYDVTTAITNAIKEKVTPKNAELIGDAYKIQSIYGNEDDDSQSLLDCFNSLKKESDENKAKVEEQENTIQSLTKDLESSRIETARCNQMKQDLKAWDKWAISMYKRVSKSTQKASASDIQSVLGNIIVNYEDSKSLQQKIDMLFAEKQILLATKCGRNFKKQSSGKIQSIKPLIWSLALAHRLMNQMKDEQNEEADDNECEVAQSSGKRKSTPIIPLSQ